MKRSLICMATALALSACTTVNMKDDLGQVNGQYSSFTAGNAQLFMNAEEQQQAREQAEALLAKPLDMASAVKVALLNSPDFQRVLAMHWAQASAAAQGGRLGNPVFTFERLASVDELELTRTLSFGLLDVLTYPLRKGVADRNLRVEQLRLAATVVDQVSMVRKAWVMAVSARQMAVYSRQVLDNAEIVADLAKRLQAAGNYSRFEGLREQVFYAQAAADYAVMQNKASQARETLVRALGLSNEQTAQLKLPERLPDLPKQPAPPGNWGADALRTRLDVQLAKAEFDYATQAQGVGKLSSFTDVELGLRRKTVFNDSNGTNTTPTGYELGIRLPLFDWGGLKRSEMKAGTLAAANQMEAALRNAGSSLRSAYSNYQTAYAVAHQYQDEIVPMQKTLVDEAQLRYNGMIVGTFELLAENRNMIASVMKAIEAQSDFWMADGELQAEQVGRPANRGQ